MKVFVFDLLAYGENLDHLKVGTELPYPLPRGTSSRTSRCAPMPSISTAWEEIDRLGYDGVGFNEHHCSPYGLMNSPNLMAAAAAQRTKRLKLLIYGNLLPLHEPLRLAEELAMLDCLSQRAADLRLRPRHSARVPGAQRAAGGIARALRGGLRDRHPRLDRGRVLLLRASSGRTRTWRMWPRPGAAAASADLDPDRRQQGIDRVRRPSTTSASRRAWRGGGLQRRHHPLLREVPRRGAAIASRPITCRSALNAYVADSQGAGGEGDAGPTTSISTARCSATATSPRPALQRQAGYSADASTDYVGPENLRAAALLREDFRNTDHGGRRAPGRAPALGHGRRRWRERIIAQADHAGADMVQIGLNRGAMPHEMFIEQIRRFAREVLPILQAHRVERVPAAEEMAA